MKRTSLLFASSIVLAHTLIGCAPSIIDAPEPGPDRPEPAKPGTTVEPADGAPLGNLAITGALARVTVVKTGRSIPRVRRAIRTGLDQISLIDETLEVRHDVSEWPPHETSRRTLGKASDRVIETDAFDNGDFTYGLVTQRGVCSDATRQDRCPLGFTVADRVRPADPGTFFETPVAKTDAFALELAAAHAGNATFWAFASDSETEGQRVFVGRSEDGSWQTRAEPVLCAQRGQQSIAVIGLADRFVVAIADAGIGGACPVTKKVELAVTSFLVGGDLTPIVTDVDDTNDAPAGVLLRPRDDGAWLLASRPHTLDLYRIEADGPLGGPPTRVPADTRDGNLLPAENYDAIATDDGGLLVAWAPVGQGPIQLARFEASGRLVERGAIEMPAHHVVTAIALAPHRDRFDIFLNTAVDDDVPGTAFVFALEISD